MKEPPRRGYLTAIFLLQIIAVAYAATDLAECCTRVPVPDDLRDLQWDACYSTYNQSELDPLRRFAPAILTTRSWCQQNCRAGGMILVSETSQWLTPFVSWVIPATAMLFLCPIAEYLPPPKRLPGWRVWLDELVFNWLDAVLGYMEILGDPASAFNGALTAMMNDVTLVSCLKRPENGFREQSLIITVLLAEQVDIETPIVRATFQILSGLDKAREYSKTACRTMLAARRKFHMSVTLPVVFYIGVAAAVFYDAYGHLGDNDTAHSLAYGIWYNWILLLSVFSNCSASNLSLEAVRSSLEVVIRGVVENHTFAETESMGWDRSVGPAKSLYEFIAASILSEKLPLPSPCPNTFEGSRAIKYQGTIEVRTLSLADRYFNALKWNKWLFDRGVDVCRPSRGILRHQRFWPDHWSRPCPRARYTVCQVLSWTFVLFPCLTAAYISYTTPTVALGCRSANHLLYALLSLLVALLRVPRAFISATKRPLLARAAAAAHTTLLWTNVLIVLIGGTILQLVGAYRTCLCAGGIFAGPDTTFNLGTNSEEHQDWARAVWLNVGYLAYGWIVGVALVALVARLWISYELREALDI